MLKFSNSKKGRALHSWVGFIVALYVFMVTISGIVHIAMSNFYSPPPPLALPGLINLNNASLPLTKILQRIPAGLEIKAINIRTIQEDLWYQIVASKEMPFYINAVTGKENPALDEDYAKQLALDYLKKEGIYQTDYLREFNDEYHKKYRLLPVYRFDVKDSNGERVYVSTAGGSIVLYLNNGRALGHKIFSNLHAFAFITNKITRDLVMFLFSVGVLVTSLIGVFIFFARKKNKKKRKSK